MNEIWKEYISSLIPKNCPDGIKLVEEGRKMGETMEYVPNDFLKARGYKSYMEYRKDLSAQGKMNWQILMGLATLEEELEGIKKINEFAERLDVDVRTIQSIPASLVGLPKEYWDKAPRPTSYLMEKPEDWKAHSDAAPINMVWQDWHLTAPSNLQTTINCINAGAVRIGAFSTYIWDYPGWDDEVNRFSDCMRSMGIFSTKKEYMTVDTYPEDGIPGYFLDVVSYVGYLLFEHYIINDLCGAQMSISFGGLLSEVQPRLALALAMHKLLATEEQPILSYFNGGTVEQWDHDIDGNYGNATQEMLAQILFEKKYKTLVAMNPVSVTERLRTPTCDELINVTAAGLRAEEKSDEWAPLMNWQPIEELADVLMEKGQKFFENMMNAFEEAGVNIKNPLELVLVMKHFNPVKMEEAFSPSVDEKGEFVPYVPSVLGRQTMAMKDDILDDMKAEGLMGSLHGEKMVCASADGHSYGLLLVDSIMSELGGTVVNGGVDMEPQVVLDLADESGTDKIMISIHCGQGLGYARQIAELANERGKEYNIFMGGMLNGLLPGHSEPVDVTDLINETGVHASNDLKDFVNFVIEKRK